MEEGERPANGGIRQLIELAISCGRKYQNEQTGFLHWFCDKEDEKDNASIPVYENLLFGLALMRSKSADTVQEGKALIEKILPFQNFLVETGKGSFPIYLHEFPHCKDRLLGIRLLPIFYYCLSQLGPLLGSAFKAKLVETSRALLQQCLHTHGEKPAPYALAFTLGICLQNFAKYFAENSLVEQGKDILASLKAPQTETCWYSPAGLSDVLIALHMLDGASLPDGWADFWQYMADTWHKPCCAYAGPGWREYQYGEEPQVSLYDLYMGMVSGAYSYRAFTMHPFLLQGALVQGPLMPLPEPKMLRQGEVDGNPWLVVQNTGYAACMLGKRRPVNPTFENGYIPLKILWGDKTKTRSFVCQGGNAETIDFEWHPNGDIRAGFLLGPLPQVEDKEKAREVIFFTGAEEDTSILVGAKKATTFNLGETLQISSGSISLHLSFSLVEGEGSFIGHIMRGNRPSQINIKGENRLKALDWQIFLRTIYRTSPCKIAVDIQINRAEDE